MANTVAQTPYLPIGELTLVADSVRQERYVIVTPRRPVDLAVEVDLLGLTGTDSSETGLLGDQAEFEGLDLEFVAFLVIVSGNPYDRHFFTPP